MGCATTASKRTRATSSTRRSSTSTPPRRARDSRYTCAQWCPTESVGVGNRHIQETGLGGACVHTVTLWRTISNAPLATHTAVRDGQQRGPGSRRNCEGVAMDCGGVSGRSLRIVEDVWGLLSIVWGC